MGPVFLVYLFLSLSELHRNQPAVIFAPIRHLEISDSIGCKIVLHNNLASLRIVGCSLPVVYKNGCLVEYFYCDQNVTLSSLVCDK
jgi:hypothetical protein